MKVRTGFVSNSSSSSFVIKEPEIKTTAECAYWMLTFIDLGNDSDIEYAISWLLENLDYDEPIMFPWSINFETWIQKTDKGICVETCNNHQWYDLFFYEYIPEVGEGCDLSIPYLDLSTMEPTIYNSLNPIWQRK